MEYWPTEQQQLIQASVQNFLATECTPQVVRAAYDTPQLFDTRLWQGLAELGVTGTLIPEDHGGVGLGLIEAALVSEELGRHTTPVFLEGHNLAGLAISKGGTPEQKERFLAGLASGELIGTLAVIGEDTGTPWPGWAVEPGGNQKQASSLVPQADAADVIIVGRKQGRIGVLEKKQTDVQTEYLDGVDGSRKVFLVTFDEGAVQPLPNLAGDALISALSTLLAADAFGVASKLLEITTEYAKTREQFGQPIAQFQAVKHQLADIALARIFHE